MEKKRELAYFAGGCFWCTEAIFKQLKGVESVISGYTGGGTKDDPNYYQHGEHAEGIKIEFDPSVISYEQLLEVFWQMHDPTTLNRQGADVGTAYRSIILYVDDQQKEIAEKTKVEIAEKVWDDPIVTEIKPFDAFTDAEDYHQDFYENNRTSPYCFIVIDPKIRKLKKNFKHLLKDGK